MGIKYPEYQLLSSVEISISREIILHFRGVLVIALSEVHLCNFCFGIFSLSCIYCQVTYNMNIFCIASSKVQLQEVHTRILFDHVL